MVLQAEVQVDQWSKHDKLYPPVDPVIFCSTVPLGGACRDDNKNNHAAAAKTCSFSMTVTRPAGPFSALTTPSRE